MCDEVYCFVISGYCKCCEKVCECSVLEDVFGIGVCCCVVLFKVFGGLVGVEVVGVEEFM